MAYAQSLIISLLASQASIAVADAGERTILLEPAAVIGQNHPAGHGTRDARLTPVTPLDRVATAVDGAESSHGKDIAMWRPDRSGPQGPMQVGEAAATDVGGGDRFDPTQNRAIGRAYLAQLYGRYKNWRDAIAAYNWGLSNVDTWIRAGRPREKLLASVAVYTTRVLYDSGSYTIAGFATARRHRCFGDRRYLTSAPDSAQRWLIHLPILHSPISILTVVHSLGTNDTSAALYPTAFLKRGCCT